MGAKRADPRDEEAEGDDQRDVGKELRAALLGLVECRAKNYVDGVGEDDAQSAAARIAPRRWKKSPTWLSDSTVTLKTSDGQNTWATLSLMSRRA